MPREAIRIEGLRSLQRDIRRVVPELKRDVPIAIQHAVEDTLLRPAQALAPHRTGRLAASLRVVRAGNRVAIRSRLPYANVIHWGGTTGRHHRPGIGGSGSVHVTANLFIAKAIDHGATRTVEAIADNLDHTFRRNGWR